MSLIFLYLNKRARNEQEYIKRVTIGQETKRRKMENRVMESKKASIEIADLK